MWGVSIPGWPYRCTQCYAESPALRALFFICCRMYYYLFCDNARYRFTASSDESARVAVFLFGFGRRPETDAT